MSNSIILKGAFDRLPLIDSPITPLMDQVPDIYCYLDARDFRALDCVSRNTQVSDIVWRNLVISQEMFCSMTPAEEAALENPKTKPVILTVTYANKKRELRDKAHELGFKIKNDSWKELARFAFVKMRLRVECRLGSGLHLYENMNLMFSMGHCDEKADQISVQFQFPKEKIAKVMAALEATHKDDPSLLRILRKGFIDPLEIPKTENTRRMMKEILLKSDRRFWFTRDECKFAREKLVELQHLGVDIGTDHFLLDRLIFSQSVEGVEYICHTLRQNALPLPPSHHVLPEMHYLESAIQTGNSLIIVSVLEMVRNVSMISLNTIEHMLHSVDDELVRLVFDILKRREFADWGDNEGLIFNWTMHPDNKEYRQLAQGAGVLPGTSTIIYAIKYDQFELAEDLKKQGLLTRNTILDALDATSEDLFIAMQKRPDIFVNCIDRVSNGFLSEIFDHSDDAYFNFASMFSPELQDEAYQCVIQKPMRREKKEALFLNLLVHDFVPSTKALNAAIAYYFKKKRHEDEKKSTQATIYVKKIVERLLERNYDFDASQADLLQQIALSENDAELIQMAHEASITADPEYKQARAAILDNVD